MALPKKLKEQARALKIPYYWNYTESNLRKLVAAKAPKKKAADRISKPRSITAHPNSIPPAKPKKTGNKKRIIELIAECQECITAERKKLKGKNAQHAALMLDRTSSAMKNAELYLSKIK